MKSQMARGVRFDNKRLSKRIKSLLSVIIPLFYNSFRKAEELAIAMEARCYRGHEGRTRYHELKYQKQDFVVYLLSLVVAIFSILS
jgi:energy-coupling factor transport system permease protein